MTRRVILLGASNLTRGLSRVVGGLSALWPQSRLEVFAALGHGRSYGARTWVLGRSLPGILPSALWKAFDESTPAPTHALLTDIGNDILYGFPPERIGEWIGEAMSRLAKANAKIIVTGLPLDSVRRLDYWRFIAFRRVFFPFSRMALEESLARAVVLDELVRKEADRHGAHVVSQEAIWYGIDPIHFRPSQASAAWKAVLSPMAEGAELPRLRLSPARWAWLSTRRPREIHWLGIPAGRSQPCARLAAGGSLSLF